jgi:hypothetical protein
MDYGPLMLFVLLLLHQFILKDVAVTFHHHYFTSHLSSVLCCIIEQNISIMKLACISASIILITISSFLTSRVVVVGQEWELLFEEDFTNPLLPDINNAPWILDDYATPFDTIMDDNGM